MINLQRFSKKIGFFKKEHALGVIVTINEKFIPEQDFTTFREGFLAWSNKFGTSCNSLIFTFMASDSKQQDIFAFFSCVLADPDVCSLLSAVQLKLQFPSMSQSVSDQTYARIYAKDL